MLDVGRSALSVSEFFNAIPAIRIDPELLQIQKLAHQRKTNGNPIRATQPFRFYLTYNFFVFFLTAWVVLSN
jgi:hypothetical protein